MMRSKVKDMDFENQLTEQQCFEYFNKMFENIWDENTLEKIIFPNGISDAAVFKNFNENSKNDSIVKCKLSFLAGYFGDSIWDIFSNNHTVYSGSDILEFSIGSWRGAGSFIAEFIESKNPDLKFDYMDFYMGHSFFKDSDGGEAKRSYQFIFEQIKKNGFDWIYNYPALGMVDFSKSGKDLLTTYNPNKAMEEELNKEKLKNSIDEINAETKNKINKASLPSIIVAYANVFGKYPQGWEE